MDHQNDDNDSYDLDDLYKLKEDLPNIKIRYAKNETGWAVALGDGRAIINNIPYAPSLRFMDVVELEPACPPDPFQSVGKVIWRGFAKLTLIRYPAPSEDVADSYWGRIRAACKAAGLAVEGYTPGWCAVNHHADTDLKQILQDADIDIDQLEFRSSEGSPFHGVFGGGSSEEGKPS